MMKMNDSDHKLAEILDKAQQEELLDRGEIVFLLGLTQKSQKLLRQRKAWLNPASTEDYFIWIEGRRRQIRSGLFREKVAC